MRQYGSITAVQLLDITNEVIAIELEFNSDVIRQEWYMSKTAGLDNRAAYLTLSEIIPPDAFYCVLNLFATQKSGPTIALQEEGVGMEGFAEAAVNNFKQLMAFTKLARLDRAVDGDGVDREKLMTLLKKSFLNPRWLDDIEISPYELTGDVLKHLEYNGSTVEKNITGGIREALDATLNVVAIYGTKLNAFSNDLFDIHTELKGAVLKTNDTSEVHDLIKAAIDKIGNLSIPKLDKVNVIGDVTWETDKNAPNILIKPVRESNGSFTISSTYLAKEFAELLYGIADGLYDDPLPMTNYPTIDQDENFWNFIESDELYDTYLSLVTPPRYSGLEVKSLYAASLHSVISSIIIIMHKLQCK